VTRQICPKLFAQRLVISDPHRSTIGRGRPAATATSNLLRT
jgi:hypothetical protein